MAVTPSDVHVNTPLTNISVAYIQDPGNFIATQVFPNVPVLKQSDRYFTFDRGAFNRDEAKVRAPSTESAGGSYDTDNTPNYFAKIWGYHHDIADELRANADPAVDIERMATLLVTQKLLLRREKLFTSSFLTTSIWANDWAGVNSGPSGNQVIKWSNYSTSTPIENVAAARTVVKQSTSFDPNTLVLARNVWDALKNHPEIVDRIKYGQTAGGPARVTVEAVAALFEVDRIVISSAIENTGKEGQSNTHSFINSGTALLCYVPPAAGLLVPSAGYTFSWTSLPGGPEGNMGNLIRKFRMDPIKSDRIEGEMAFDMKLVSADLGFFWSSIV